MDLGREVPKVERLLAFGNVVLMICKTSLRHILLTSLKVTLQFLLGLDYDGKADTLSRRKPAIWRKQVGQADYEFRLYIARDTGGNLRRYVEFRPLPQTILRF